MVSDHQHTPGNLRSGVEEDELQHHAGSGIEPVTRSVLSGGEDGLPPVGVESAHVHTTDQCGCVRRLGRYDPRRGGVSVLWPAVLRVDDETRPQHVVGGEQFLHGRNEIADRQTLRRDQ